MNFSSERHEKLIEREWDPAKVMSVIESIYTDCLEQIESNSNKTIYHGSAGALWSLLKISKFLDQAVELDAKVLIQKIYHNYLSSPDTEEVVPSLFLGEVGILLVSYVIDPSQEIEEKIFELVKANIENPTLEALWAAPGTMIAASWFYHKTKDESWKNLFVENATFLLGKLREEKTEDLIWQQDLYGSKIRYVGAGHGYFGNMYGILKNLELLSADDQQYVLAHIETVLSKLAIEEEGTVNWAPLYPIHPDGKMLVQWCHGAPGIINSLKFYPKHSAKVEELLLKGGELIWRAGPLTKGVGICHGTDGNGFALLQLYRRTGDRQWLDRARAFAMHCLDQRKQVYELFTGDMGLALYLIACLEESDYFPFLDDF